jgi:phenylalanyl-tRNA synthetase beta chain
LAVLFYNKASGFEIVHGVLDRLMQVLEVPWKTGYHLTHIDGKFLFANVSNDLFGFETMYSK